MTVTDKLSKRVVLIEGRKSDSALDAARRFCDRVYAEHGLPRITISDRDTRFTSKFWTELMKALNIRQNMSTALHPQTDGLAEATNKNTLCVINAMITTRNESWVQHLPMAQFQIKNSISTTTGVTPFYADTGRHSQTDLGQLPSSTLPTAHEFAKQMKEQTRALVQRLEERLEKE